MTSMSDILCQVSEELLGVSIEEMTPRQFANALLEITGAMLDAYGASETGQRRLAALLVVVAADGDDIKFGSASTQHYANDLEVVALLGAADMEMAQMRKQLEVLDDGPWDKDRGMELN